MTLTPTPSQTVGPYYTIGLARRREHELAHGPGTLRLAGQLLDGGGAPIDDGMIELWDPAGGRWGRSGTDAGGRFAFTVAKPDALPGQAPRFDVFVFARGLLRHQLTRIYLPDEPGNAADPVLSALTEEARSTLIAARSGDGLRFDIRMQGERATVFFAH